MIEYVKTILLKVSFDKKLFEKELKKGLSLLVPSEVQEFKTWCYGTFSNLYGPVLNKHFTQIAA
ncbi:hypothetical protein KIH41_12965 [Litoribacter ruber]|uniref:Uncharacterized protein n=1 Tax=Litoribacter ruber TaxID=702568 RepID=A0AAP2CH53_9BACT|nr:MULTISPECIES: hypothetical protein [Litoribacter]MBS9523675.1 hypothetical protein [Litoribacter alkaliphilus]MBT0812189.1 hypothetical protein [Litoribacter ruber]